MVSVIIRQATHQKVTKFAAFVFPWDTQRQDKSDITQPTGASTFLTQFAQGMFARTPLRLPAAMRTLLTTSSQAGQRACYRSRSAE
jgi:hypothetical protein